jgi:hypothetical protein
MGVTKYGEGNEHTIKVGRIYAINLQKANRGTMQGMYGGSFHIPHIQGSLVNWLNVTDFIFEEHGL